MELTNRQARYVIASTLFVLALSGAPTDSHALSCAPRQFTLSEAYEAADSIIVGLITECKEEVSSEPWANGGSDCSFSTMEVLKGSVPTRDYSGVTSSSGCGLSLYVGGQYLLFLDSKNQPMRFSATLSGDQYQARLANEYVRIVRDFKNGTTSDLAEPWIFGEHEGSCSISQSIGGNRVSFIHRSPDAPQQPEPDWTQELINGETAYRTNVPTFNTETNASAGTVEIVAFGDSPTLAGNALMLSVSLQETSPAPFRRATLSVGSKKWSLDRVEINLAVTGTYTHTTVNYNASGNVAEQILAAMAHPSDVLVSAALVATENNSNPTPGAAQPDHGGVVQAPSKQDYIGPELPETSSTGPAITPSLGGTGSFRSQKEPPKPLLRLESRSTHISGVIERFRDCYEGDAR